MKIKVKSITETEQEILFPCFRKSANNKSFLWIKSEESVEEVIFYGFSDPSLVSWSFLYDKSKLHELLGEHSNESNEQEFESALQKYVEETNRYNDLKIEKAKELLMQFQNVEEAIQ